MSVSEDPLVGIITLVTKDGRYDFLINETIANQIIQEARAFLRAARFARASRLRNASIPIPLIAGVGSFPG